MKLRESDPDGPGIRRVRRGSGFRYRSDAGGSLDAATLQRIKALAIPPAWSDVWVCLDARGHIQAIGVDAAGRRQYIYHDDWRRMRDEAKFDRMLELAEALPGARRAVGRDLRRPRLDRRRALGAAFRMIDRAAVRVGGEEYRRLYGSRGVTTLRCRDVLVEDDTITLGFPSKSGQLWESSLRDRLLARYLATVIGMRGPSSRVVSWRDSRWHPVTSAELNDYIRERTGVDATAKDFRTLRGTIVAATSLAESERGELVMSAEAAIRDAMSAAAHELGNTPAIARVSYVDPRVVDRFRAGDTITLREPAERAVRRLLR
ncbi:DNA topoisomerase IB [Planctomonas sp. JC2975]|nr:DNA topoisomerase IB [Planctomonas sp. JC2975]